MPTLEPLTGTFLAALAAVLLGLSDFFCANLIDRLGDRVTMLLLSFTNMTAMVGIAVFTGKFTLNFGMVTWSCMLGLTAVNYTGTVLLYKAFQKGPIAAVSAFSSGFAIVAILLSLIFNEMTPRPTIAVSLVMSGIIVLMLFFSSNKSQHQEQHGFHEAIASAVFLGIFFWGINRANRDAGIIMPLVIMRVGMFAMSLIQTIRYTRKTQHSTLGQLIGLAKNRFGLWNRYRIGIVILLITMLDTGAFLSYSEGGKHTYTSLSSAILASYAVVTMIASAIWGKEKSRITPAMRAFMVIYIACMFVANIEW